MAKLPGSQLAELVITPLCAVAETAYSEKYRLGRLIAETSSFKQKASGATFGGVVKMPAFIATMTGIA